MQARVDFEALTRRFVAAQLAGDREQALHVVVDDGLLKGARVVDLEAQVLRTAQQEIGRLWQTNEISVAKEHLATAIAHVAQARLFGLAPRTRPSLGTVAIACVEGERHDFPARLVADYLELGGFDVRYFGADVPTDALAAALEEDRPRALALSVTLSLHVPAFRTAVERVHGHLGADFPILAGGAALALAPHLGAELGITTGDGTPDEIVGAMRRAIGVQ